MSEFDRHEPGFDVLHKVSERFYTFTTQFHFQGQHPTHNRGLLVHIPARSGEERGALAIINPAEPKRAVLEQIHRLERELAATARYLISPGDWHWLFLGAHLAAFPEATAYVPPGRIPSRKPDFAYEQARAITSGDVLYYLGVDELSERQKALGQRPRVVDFHFAKWRMVRDASAVQRSLERILAWDFDRYISVHGGPGNMLEAGAKEHVARILEWAKAGPTVFVER